MTDLARDRKTIGGSLDNISDLTVVVADLLRRGPAAAEDGRRAAARARASCSTSRRTSEQIIELLDRLPESMTDQTRTGTYGSWYSYYVCGFSGRITLPASSASIPGIKQLDGSSSNLNFHSTAPRSNGAERSSDR